MLDSIPESSNSGSQPEQKTPSDFTSFAQQNGFKPPHVEADKRFGVKRLKSENGAPSQYIVRDYFAENPSGGFSKTAEATISGIGVELAKFGREIPAKGGFYREEEAINFFGDVDWGFETIYALKHLKGQVDYDGKINNVAVRFDKEGKMDFMEFEEHDGSIIATHFIGTEMKKHFNSNREPFVSKTDGGITLICERDSNSYVVYIISADGQLRHKLTAGNRIDLNGIVAELGVVKLMTDPFQPSEGTPRKSIGDRAWRYENLGALMGVSVVPVDKPDEKEFDKKGFRALIEDVKKEI